MTWFKVDDQFSEHKKVRRLGRDKLAAIGLWTLCGNWSAATLSDGFVPGEIVQRYDPEEKLAESLARVGLWERAELDDEAGYQFHDWDDHQPSKADVEARRKADADRRARWREAKQGKSPESESQRESQRASRRDTTRDTTRDSQQESRPVSSLPDPTRPDPTRPEESLRDSSSSGSSNRGTSPARANTRDKVTALAATAHTPAAHRLVEDYAKTCTKRPPTDVLNKLGPKVDGLIEDGYTETQIRSGLATWGRKGLGSSFLPEIVHEMVNSGRGQRDTPAGDLPDEYFTRERVEEILGNDYWSPETPPREVRDGPHDGIRDWLAGAHDERHRTVRVPEARRTLALRQERRPA